jgi:Putative lumazine-binding
MNKTSIQYAEVAALLDTYIESQHDFSDKKLDAVFAPQAMVYANWDDGLVAWPLPEFKSMLKTIPNPHENGMPLVGQVASIELLSRNTAMAVVETQLYDDVYSDFLTLIKIDGRWAIYCKVFSKRNQTQAIR